MAKYKVQKNGCTQFILSWQSATEKNVNSCSAWEEVGPRHMPEQETSETCQKLEIIMY